MRTNNIPLVAVGGIGFRHFQALLNCCDASKSEFVGDHQGIQVIVLRAYPEITDEPE